MHQIWELCCHIFLLRLDLTSNTLSELLKTNIEDSFNAISVDGDMSTNDTVAVFAIGNKKFKKIIKKHQFLKLISTSLKKIMRNLALANSM